MSKNYDQSFKNAAVQRALLRQGREGLQGVADDLNIAVSTLHRWLKTHLNQINTAATTPENPVKIPAEKRPNDWNLAERLAMIISCENKNESEISAACREKGIYSSHIAQWRQEFTQPKTANTHTLMAEIKILKKDKEQLEKSILKKDKVMAELTAVIVLQKKVQALFNPCVDD
jgi:transposase